MDLILFSTDHSDLKMIEAATWLAEDDINLYAFFDNAAWTGPGGALFGYRDILILQATHMTEWGMRLPSFLLHDFVLDQDKLILDAGFFVANMDWFPAWLDEARDHDFFSATGKFIDSTQNSGPQDYRRFAFPSWECAFISKELWRVNPVRFFLRKAPLHAPLYEQHRYERLFFERFSKGHKFGSAMDHLETTQFDPSAGPRFSMQDVWDARQAAQQALAG